MTHDLFINVLAETGWALEAITVTKLEEKTFHAELRLTSAEGDTRLVDARPSDSIALALRAGAEILVAPPVLDAAGGRAPEDDVEAAVAEAVEAAAGGSDDAEAAYVPLVDANTDLEDVDPELFSKYKM